MRRSIRVTLASAALILLATTVALAANPHFVKGPFVSLQGNTLTIAASVAGLGNVDEADATLTGTVEVFARCYNRGGNKPQADNKQETIEVDEFGTFPVRNGRTNVSFQISPVSTLVCPGNQRVVIESFSWDLILDVEGATAHIVGSAP